MRPSQPSCTPTTTIAATPHSEDNPRSAVSTTLQVNTARPSARPRPAGSAPPCATPRQGPRGCAARDPQADNEMVLPPAVPSGSVSSGRNATKTRPHVLSVHHSALLVEGG